MVQFKLLHLNEFYIFSSFIDISFRLELQDAMLSELLMKEREIIMNSTFSPYLDFSRDKWSALRKHTPLTLSETDLEQIRGVNENISIREVEDVYLPLTRLVNLKVEASQDLHRATTLFLDEKPAKIPYIIGIAGSVAVGKSTIARLLQLLLSRWESHRHVELITTDGFLFPNRELEQRGIMNRKGFPESYDTQRLIQVISEIKSGAASVEVPLYSHTAYDIVNEKKLVNNPDILIVEGVNVLQVNDREQVFVSDFFDFSIYIDADISDLEEWYIDRFLFFKDTAFKEKESYFHKYAALSDQEAIEVAKNIWKEINEKNLVENILPTKGRGSLVLRKGSSHRVERIMLHPF